MKNGTMKVVAAMMMCVTLLLPATIPVKAEAIRERQAPESLLIVHDGSESVRWIGTAQASPNIAVSGTTVTAYVLAQSSVSGAVINGSMYLESYTNGSWRSVTGWGVYGTNSVYISRSIQGSKGTRYRTRFSGRIGSEWVNAVCVEKTL